MTQAAVPGPPAANPPAASPPTVTPPATNPPAPVATDLDCAIAELAATLPELALAEHPDRLAVVQELLQRALDEGRADR